MSGAILVAVGLIGVILIAATLYTGGCFED